jgi:receptor protein-tyrosine kinase
MSLIERAVDKFGADRPRPAPMRDRTYIAPEGPPQRSKDSTAGDPSRPRKSGASLSAVHAAGPVPRPAQEEADALDIEARGTDPGQSGGARTSSASRTIQIPIKRLIARGFVAPDGVASAISQEFRVIKRPLLANAFGRGTDPLPRGRMVMVSSAFPGEGKSFCAINLALSIAAERDTRVLLVDADVARPSLPRELGIRSSAGLMDWLIDGTPELERLVRPTNVERLSLLQAGRRHDHATELLASDSMACLLDLLATRYPDRIIIFDSPPLLITTESRVLASYMGQIVLVVEAGNTPREAVKEALASVGDPGMVGLVLNKSRDARAGGHYGYEGYGYGAG